MNTAPFNIGFLTSRLIKGGWLDEAATERVISNVRDTIMQGVKKATRDGEKGRQFLLPLMDEIGELPLNFTEEQWGEFWLGYYQGRRGPGRPKGTVKTESVKKAHDITVTDEAWDHAKAQDNASSFIESLILAHKGTV